jgi:hypothetical protein
LAGSSPALDAGRHQLKRREIEVVTGEWDEHRGRDRRGGEAGEIWERREERKRRKGASRGRPL